MGKPRACDVCSLRKIKCNGSQPCSPCLKADFDCSYAKKPLKPGPKGPRASTSNRIRKKLQVIRSSGRALPQQDAQRPSSSSSTTRSPRSPSFDWLEVSLLQSSTSNITLDDVRKALQIYALKMYPVWPVVHKDKLLDRLSVNKEGLQNWALAYAVCAATGAQLRLNDHELGTSKHKTSIIDRFAKEAERCRTLLRSQEKASIETILVAFFLHMYYSACKKKVVATILLRESLTLCEILDLDKEAAYTALDEDEQKYRRKVFWLLFVTERGHAIQTDMATILRPSIAMSKVEDDADPIQFAGFLRLVRLFVAVEGTLTGSGIKDVNHAFTPEIFLQLQQKLHDEPQLPFETNEVQRTDITVTQLWMRMLVWQLAMKTISMTAGSSENPLSLTYPAHVARDSLAFLSKVSLDSVIAHGPGMEIKIFEIASSLHDLITILPSLADRGSATLMQQGPRDIFDGLCQVLVSVGSTGNHLALLQGKVSQSVEPFMSVPRFEEMRDDSISSTDAPFLTDAEAVAEEQHSQDSTSWNNMASIDTMTPGPGHSSFSEAPGLTVMALSPTTRAYDYNFSPFQQFSESVANLG